MRTKLYLAILFIASQISVSDYISVTYKVHDCSNITSILGDMSQRVAVMYVSYLLAAYVKCTEECFSLYVNLKCFM